MHELLTDSILGYINPENSSRAKAREALYTSILNAPTLSAASAIAGVTGYRVSWGRYEENPYHMEGWQVMDASRQRCMAISVYQTALVYAVALPRLRCPERRARCRRVVENCAQAIEHRAYSLSRTQREADAAEVRALI